MKIDNLPDLIAAHEGTDGHILLLDINTYDRTMRSFPNDFLQECKLVVEIDRGAGAGFVVKSDAVRNDRLLSYDGHPAVQV